MEDSTRAQIVREAKRVFFAGMMDGYAAGKTPSLTAYAMSGIENSKLHHYEDFTGKEFQPDWKPTGWNVEDTYVIGRHGSAGWTFITYNQKPIWYMQYGGEYEQEAIPLLKAALCSNYQAGTFFGGRGPVEFQDPAHPDMMYVNVPGLSDRSSFDRFSGVEHVIITRDGKTIRHLGYHEYSGRLMV